MNNTVKSEADPDFNKILNGALRVFFKNAVKIALTSPSQSVFFLKTFRWQKKAAKTRLRWESQGIHVPPVLVISVTSQCNLHCEGCYHQALRNPTETEMSDERIERLIEEAKELGISFIVLAGGEPLMRPNILDLSKKTPEIMFMMFTNGLLINDEVLEKIVKNKNVVPLLSLEGYQIDTDGRRGSGVYSLLLKSIAKLKDKKVFWGTSLTMTRSNFEEVTDEAFIKQLVDSGCKLFMLVEYTPVVAETEDWILTEEQKARVIGIRNSFRSKFPALFIALPWDEEEIGGCLSAGRGFVHISAEGNVEPCPFVAYSDTNLKNISLKEALQSKILKTIRENHAELREIQGCALWEKREWVQSLAKSSEGSTSEK
ncbi:MAG TPA: radical SAM protein [Candidatus Bathyarchaeia archaeon]|nr:radical SAM protein [Candidatus Bathyarchaeia archaeon]